MTRLAFVLSWLVPLILAAGCTNPDTAIFATVSAFGVNVDSKPPTVAIAYDRFEGFIGPRYGNGGAPPVVASMETDGNAVTPRVRQTYATGAAAVNAVGGDVTGPEGLQDNKKLMLFGTATTVGIKVGFGTEGVPDSLVFGYRRKEASIIPLGEDGQKAVYPSVLASIDTGVKAQSQLSTSMTTRQFFATGAAADKLAKNPIVTAAFEQKSTETLLDSLSREQLAAAKEAGTKLASDTDKKLTVILAAISCDGGNTLDTGLRDKLVTATPVAPAWLTKRTTLAAFRAAIADNPTIVSALHQSAVKQGSPTCPTP